MKEKSILEQALLQVETLEEAVKANAKGILASTMKQELNELLKESMEKEEEVDEQQIPKEEEEKDMSDEAETSEQEDEDADDEDTDLDNEPEKDIDSLDSEDDELPSDDEMGAEDDEMDSEGDEMNPDDEFGPDEDLPMDNFGGDFEDDEEDVLDMTGASNDEVLKVFKAMKPEDGIIVKKDGNNVELETGDDDFIIKLDEEENEEEVSEEWNEEEMSEGDDAPFEKDVHEEEETEDETIYEIDLDDDDSNEGDVEESSHEVEATEAARTKWNPHGDKGGANRTGLKSKKMFKAGSGQINEEVEKLKKQNAEYKKALILFKEKLNEVAVFNANLAYATRLFTEHSTTKQEKMSILKRFDSISTMNESKNLFNTIKTELETKKPVTEAVVDKITSTPSTSSSEVLSESKAYVNPQFKRMKELMGKIK